MERHFLRRQKNSSSQPALFYDNLNTHEWSSGRQETHIDFLPVQINSRKASPQPEMSQLHDYQSLGGSLNNSLTQTHSQAQIISNHDSSLAPLNFKNLSMCKLKNGVVTGSIAAGTKSSRMLPASNHFHNMKTPIIKKVAQIKPQVKPIVYEKLPMHVANHAMNKIKHKQVPDHIYDTLQPQSILPGSQYSS